MSRKAAWTTGVGSAIAVILYSLAINWSALANPPAWDSAMTVGPAAISIAERGFDVWEVANLPSSLAGGPSTHATSAYTVLLALLIDSFSAPNALAIAHLLSIALLGALSGATYMLAREVTTPAMGALAAVVAGVMPVMVQQSADLYLDLPLGVLATLASWSTLRKRFWLTATLVFLAIAVKSSAIFLLPLLLFVRPANRSIKQHLILSGVTGALCSIPFLVTLATTHRLSTGLPLSQKLPLIGDSLALLILTSDIFLLLALYTVVTYGRIRSGTPGDLPRVSLALLASFIAVHVATIAISGTIAILPRYYVAIIPTAMVATLPSKTAGTRMQAIGVTLLVALGVFSLINVEGSFYPRSDDDFYVLAERSTRAQTLLRLQIEGTQALVDTGVPLLVERTVHFRVEYPEMGYVDRKPVNIELVGFSPPEAFPQQFAMLIERRVNNPIVEVEAAAIARGYRLTYTEMAVGEFRSQLVLATRD